MNTTTYGSDLDRLTAQLVDGNQRQACVVTALVKHKLGGLAQAEPRMLDEYLESRRISAPVKLLVKAAVTAADTTSGLAPSRPMVAAFIGAVDRRSVLGQLGAVKVPGTNAVGAVQTGSPTAYWVGEQVAKPLSALAFAAMSLTPRKVVADVPVADELLKFASADALWLIERSSVSAVASALDTARLDPTNAGTANVKPASLTNGLVAITPAGDFQNNAGQALAGISGGAPTRPVLIVSLQTALRLTALRDLEAIGVRVLVSPAAGNRLIAVDADGIAYVDDGGAMQIGQPDIQMDDSPTTPSVAATVMVSTWQRNIKVIRGERWTNWAKRADAVAYLTLA